MLLHLDVPLELFPHGFTAVFLVELYQVPGRDCPRGTISVERDSKKQLAHDLFPGLLTGVGEDIDRIERLFDPNHRRQRRLIRRFPLIQVVEVIGHEHSSVHGGQHIEHRLRRELVFFPGDDPSLPPRGLGEHEDHLEARLDPACIEADALQDVLHHRGRMHPRHLDRGAVQSILQRSFSNQLPNGVKVLVVLHSKTRENEPRHNVWLSIPRRRVAQLGNPRLVDVLLALEDNGIGRVSLHVKPHGRDPFELGREVNGVVIAFGVPRRHECQSAQAKLRLLAGRWRCFSQRRDRHAPRAGLIAL
mmetsp:Transcript_8011/g.29977  ORF Transcript_8011/g.29977 Transcript_8011/m.29977 type:complete len:304 (+) Transcript_8011:1492-2403(+)